MKRIILSLIIVMCLVVYFVFCIISLVDKIKFIFDLIEWGIFDFKYYNQNSGEGTIFTDTINSTIFVIISMIVSVYAVLKTILTPFLKHELKYTYEEYKAEKQEKKKQKLQRQLNRLDKTE